MSRKVFWNRKQEHVASDLGELRRLLAVAREDAAKNGPLTFFVIGDGEDVLTIGLGQPVTVLNLSSSSGNWTTVGAAKGGEDELEFRCLDDHSYFSPAEAVPVETGLLAVEKFFVTGQRPTDVDWKQI